ncbi:MAG: LuxR family transcriptional regulator [Micromonosporaceae bacterium]|nr:LuxR family transcriptional regulator [Micromonosporaceae bacterium]
MSLRTSVPPALPRPDERSRALRDAVDAAPQVARRVCIRAPGGYGKSVLLQDLGGVYRRAGIPVLDAWHDPLAPPEPDGGTSPGVVLADDAQLLGEDRLRELHQLMQARRLGLVLAYRPWPRPPALAELLRVAGPPVRLAPFTAQQTADFLDADVGAGAGTDPELVEFLHAQTGGVPRLVDRLVRVLDWPSRELPVAALAPFRADLDELDRDLRTVLLAAATDLELTADLLGDLLGREPAATDEVLDAARATGLLGPDGRLVPIARRAVALLSPEAHRTAVWQRLAELQRARGGGVLPLVRSLREVGAGGPGLAGVFEAAADEALTEEPALAAELLKTAAASRPAAAARRALAAALAGDLDLGLRLADPLIAAGSASDRAAGAAVAATALAHRGQLGRSAELHRWSGTASSVAFATVGFLGAGQPDRAEQPLPDGPPTLLASAAALMAGGVRESVSGSPTVALSRLVQACALLEPASRAVLLPDSPAALATLVALHGGELEIGESVLERAIAVQMGAQLMSRRHQLLQAWILMARGRTAAAGQRRAAAVAGATRLEPRDLLFAAALDVGIARRNSDLAALHRGWGQAREAVIRHPFDLFTLLPLGELAVAAARLGEQSRLRPHLQEAYRLLDRLGDPPLWATPLRWSGVHAAILAEEPAVADEHVAALTATAHHSRFAAVVATGAEIWVEVLRGTVDPGAVEAAARGLHGAGLWWDAARLAGQAAIRTSDRRAMTRLLDCARVLQGRPAGAEQGAAQPAGGEGGDRAAGTATGQLSQREQEVATLLLDGLTYKQIGDRLFISAKTVEHHVARMRQRLDCASRSDLLARLRAIAADRPGGVPIRRPPWPRRPVD